MIQDHVDNVAYEYKNQYELIIHCSFILLTVYYIYKTITNIIIVYLHYNYGISTNTSKQHL